METKLEEPSVERAHQRLMMYTALDNRLRLRSFFLIAKNAGISFNQIHKRLKVERGHLAYHLGILKVAGLVNLTLERRGKSTSSYSLTDRGKEMYDELLKHS